MWGEGEGVDEREAWEAWEETKGISDKVRLSRVSSRLLSLRGLGLSLVDRADTILQP